MSTSEPARRVMPLIFSPALRMAAMCLSRRLASRPLAMTWLVEGQSLVESEAADFDIVVFRAGEVKQGGPIVLLRHHAAIHLQPRLGQDRSLGLPLPENTGDTGELHEGCGDGCSLIRLFRAA